MRALVAAVRARAQHPRPRAPPRDRSAHRRRAATRRADGLLLGRLRARPRQRRGAHASRARATVLATGGAGKVYLYTTNPDIATGDGVAMAYRAGVPIANMEFIQFHPTCLYHPAGQIVPDQRGAARRGRDPAAARRRRRSWRATTRDAELAPRDIVARAIDNEMKVHGFDYVFLDITPSRRAISCVAALPDHLRALPDLRHRHRPASRSRSCPRRTTAAAARSPTPTAPPTSAASTPSARWP